MNVEETDDAFLIQFGGGGYFQRKAKRSATEPDLSVHEHAICELAAEVRRLRREASDVFECAGATVAKDASVAAQSWADECRRLREQEAKARELATITIDTLDDLRADALRDEWSHWLAEGE